MSIYKGGSIYYKTNKTQWFVYKDYEIDKCIYGELKRNYFGDKNIMLDILKNKEKILATIRTDISMKEDMLKDLLG